VKIVRIAALSLTMIAAILVTAAPAGAAPVLADSRYKWFYWIGPLLMVGAILFLVALGVGYYIRVLRPKYRGRPVNK
jgi:bacteriorhodopsin